MTGTRWKGEEEEEEEEVSDSTGPRSSSRIGRLIRHITVGDALEFEVITPARFDTIDLFKA